ncbi:hypothetical protein CA606_18075 [Caulobacter vibrioides]|uniref:Uncharacterized protein n=1 Tax=Caulobacter vibrioides TaxID=155892 RepID=A0A290N308_CAUVI|nr:hypothetical protein [Caulobacter vibrioides]ATC34083.1 hypothetical protein CA606_18075 [Caulobacter vibrioides]
MTSPFGQWYAARCVIEAGATSRGLDLYADYKVWAVAQGHAQVMSIRAFGDALQQRQHVLAGRDAERVRLRAGLRLRQTSDIAAAPRRIGNSEFYAWAAARLVIDPAETTSFSALLNDYAWWCDRQERFQSLSARYFAGMIAEVLPWAKTTNGGGITVYAGVRLAPGQDPPGSPPTCCTGSADPGAPTIRRALAALLRSLAARLDGRPPAPPEPPAKSG